MSCTDLFEQHSTTPTQHATYCKLQNDQQTSPKTRCLFCFTLTCFFSSKTSTPQRGPEKDYDLFCRPPCSYVCSLFSATNFCWRRRASLRSLRQRLARAGKGSPAGDLRHCQYIEGLEFQGVSFNSNPCVLHSLQVQTSRIHVCCFLCKSKPPESMSAAFISSQESMPIAFTAGSNSNIPCLLLSLRGFAAGVKPQYSMSAAFTAGLDLQQSMLLRSLRV